MKAGDYVKCVDWLGCEGLLKSYQTYQIEAVVKYMDEVPGSSDPATYYGNHEDVSERGLILVGVDARYECGGRMAFKMSRFVPLGYSVGYKNLYKLAEKEVKDVF